MSNKSSQLGPNKQESPLQGQTSRDRWWDDNKHKYAIVSVSYCTAMAAWDAATANAAAELERVRAEATEYIRQTDPQLESLGRKVEALEAEAAGMREALKLARDYVESAAIRLYDGTSGTAFRKEASRRLAIIDAALAAPATKEVGRDL